MLLFQRSAANSRRASCFLESVPPKQAAFLRPFTRLMVVTRAKVKAAAFPDGRVQATVKAEVHAEHSERPAKRRKVSKPKATTTVAPKEVPTDAAVRKVAPSNGKQEAPAAKKGKVKSAKKLLATLHTEKTLPSVQAKAQKIYTQLMQMYKDPPCPLDHANAFQLLCSVILSAQSTDKKVNEIVPPLYAIAPTAAKMAFLEVPVIEEHIRKIGLAPTKAKNISAMSKTAAQADLFRKEGLLEHYSSQQAWRALVKEHSGEVPDNFEALERLAGVGHKTASVLLAVAYGMPTFPVDTHIYRLGLRWGLTSGQTVEQAEADLKVCWPQEQWNALHLRLIYFGREHCSAQRHDPENCPICCWAAVAPYNKAGKSPLRAGSRSKLL